MRFPILPRTVTSRLAAGLKLSALLLAVVRLVFIAHDHLERPRPTVRAAGSIHSCPVRIAALVPVDSDDPRGLVASDFAVVLAYRFDEARVSGALWINASGKPYRVAFHDRGALASDLTGTIDPIVVHLPEKARLEEAFVDRYVDGSVTRPCAIHGDWPGTLTSGLHDDMLARIGRPASTGALPAESIANPNAQCENRNAFPKTIDDIVPSIPIEARRKHLAGDVDVLLQLDAASVVTSMAIQSSPSAILNSPSLDATRASFFRTEIRHCRPVAAKFIFVVSYLADRR